MKQYNYVDMRVNRGERKAMLAYLSLRRPYCCRNRYSLTNQLAATEAALKMEEECLNTMATLAVPPQRQ